MKRPFAEFDRLGKSPTAGTACSLKVLWGQLPERFWQPMITLRVDISINAPGWQRSTNQVDRFFMSPVSALRFILRLACRRRTECNRVVMRQAYLIARSIGEHGFVLLQLDQIPAGHTGGATKFQRDFPDDLCVHLSVPVIRRAFEPIFFGHR